MWLYGLGLSSIFSGFTLLGSAMQVEPSMSANKGNNQNNGGRRYALLFCNQTDFQIELTSVSAAIKT
jgi:hypothetical protein